MFNYKYISKLLNLDECCFLKIINIWYKIKKIKWFTIDIKVFKYSRIFFLRHSV